MNKLTETEIRIIKDAIEAKKTQLMRLYTKEQNLNIKEIRTKQITELNNILNRMQFNIEMEP